MENRENREPKKELNAYSLAGMGIGGIVGAGFFLGVSLAITQAGPSVILAFLFGGLIMSQVLGAMTSISINRPVRGSFRVYTEQFLGPFVGFVLGWVIFTSGILAIASEGVAAGVFLRYWFPAASVPVLSITVLALVIAVNAVETRYLGYFESAMAVLKIAVLIVFIAIGISFIMGKGIVSSPNPFNSFNAFFPNGISGFLQSMLIVVFTYGGISVVAMAASEVKNPKRDIPKATVLLTFGIVILYVISIAVIISVLNLNSINTNTSPFVQALDRLGVTWASVVINGIILIATISVMAGTFFTNVQMLVSLSEAHKAPNLFTRSSKRGFHRNTWILTSITSLLIVALSFIIGTKLFNYLVSASSYFSFLNWILNLLTYLIWMKKRNSDESLKSPLILGRAGAYVTLVIIVILFFISLTAADFRIGFYAAAAFIILISLSFRLVRQ